MQNLYSLQFFLLFSLTLTSTYCNVIELNENFLQQKDESPWLVKFYAPWCGYCRRLEPVYSEVGNKLRGSDVKVGRLDATVYPAIASHYEVRGYPTIKYIHGETALTLQGDRSSERILQFVERARGPSLKNIANVGTFRNVLDKIGSETFFLYIGSYNGSLYEEYKRLANEYQLKSFFYAASSINVLDKSIKSVESFLSSYDSLSPTILAIKDSQIYSLPQSYLEQSIDSGLHKWFMIERFPTFPKLYDMDLYEFMDSKRYVALFVVNQSNIYAAGINADKAVFHMGKKFAKERLPEFYNFIQVAYMSDIASASSIVMSQIVTPNLIVVHPITQHFYLRSNYTEPLAIDTKEEEVLDFFRDILSGKAAAYGGDGFFPKLKRGGYEFYNGLISFIVTSPGLALLVLGIPIGVVSFLVYAICCMDLGEQDEEEIHLRRERSRLERAQRSLVQEFPLTCGVDENSEQKMKDAQDDCVSGVRERNIDSNQQKQPVKVEESESNKKAN